jgi:hypothetical protein
VMIINKFFIKNCKQLIKSILFSSFILLLIILEHEKNKH